jgi:PAS domain S-box-containing protein
VRSKLYLGLVVSTALAAALIVATLWFSTVLQNDNAWVRHTLEVRKQISQVANLLRDTERGQRGFLLTGRDSYLAPFDDAIKALPVTLDAMTALVSDNPQQQETIGRLRRLIAVKLREETSTIDEYSAGNAAAVLAMVEAAESDRTMTDIQNDLSKMDIEENRLIAIRESSAATSATLTRVGAATAFLLICAVGVLIGYYTRDSLAARTASDQLTKHERMLLESATRLRAVVETAVDGVILIDERGRILMFNTACERLFQYRADEVINENVKLLMPSSYRVEHDGYIRNFLDIGERKSGVGREVIGQRKDGSTFPMDLSAGEAKQDGEAIFVGIIHDLTERKRTEEQLVQAQKMEAVGQLSGGIAHDFNNLLTVIVGNAEFLSEKLKSRQDLKQLADDIGRAGDRGGELTQQLLAFSRRQVLRPVEIECDDLLESMHKMLRRTMREDIEVETDFDHDIPLAFADPAQLESAVLNIALNAQDAMPSGGRLTISTANASLDDHYRSLHPEVLPGEYVLVSITDDGQGMSKEVIERAFEPFFTTKEVGKGSGLGLSMVYGFVKQSNGHVSIYSEPGLGTTIRIYLPQAGTKSPRPVVQILTDDELPRGAETVMVVEDDPFVRSYAVMRLESLGYSVIAAVDGADALQKLRADLHVDILFTDIVMPGGINGWDLADLARQLRPGLPVLLTSGYALETLAKHGRLRAGAIVLTKPYRKADLARRLREVVSVSQLLSRSLADTAPVTESEKTKL